MANRLHHLRFSALPEVPARRLTDAIEGDAVSPPLSVAMVRNGDDDTLWIVEALFESPPDKTSIGNWLYRAVGEQSPRPQFTVTPLAEQDWVARSQAALAPVHAGRFVIHGRHDRDRFTHHRFALEIDAAQAFGTGHHATTTSCLLAIERYLKSGNPRSMLDIGTGTGILAMATAKSSMAAILASDMDPLAVALARDNARANGVANRIHFVVAAGTAHPEIATQNYDLITANILARPLVDLAGDITRLTAIGGTIILSGLLTTQACAVAGPYRAHGAIMVHRIERDGWSTLVLKKSGRGTPPHKKRAPA